MYGNSRIERVTDPLDDKMKARIIGSGGDLPRELGYISSGSEHSAESDNDVVSPSFSGLVFGFPDDLAAQQNQSPENDDSESESEDEDHPELIFQSDTDLFRNMLTSHVHKAVELYSCVEHNNKSMIGRNVMMCLRDFGYNAAICKAKWESSGGLTAGNYEFIDVVKLDTGNWQQQTRYIIDLDFAAEFEIARPTSSYKKLFQSLPKVFVGKSEELKPILRTMSDASRRSLKSRGLHLPPWRKHRFMVNKWLGQYKRTTNLVPSSVNSTATLTKSYPVKCRSVGFDAVNGGLWLPPTVTRTR